MEIFRVAEILSEQLGATHGATLIDNQTSVRLVVKKRLRNSEDDQRIKTAAHEREHERGQDGRTKFCKKILHIQMRWRVVMTRSTSLIPMKGTMTPPSP